ncbi:hypothetical protein AcV5_009884 [Taiwanofungus camphoratus]|nr:hypothetical protein AcV5_009884 [Antrodia cinnamomea]
MSCQNNITRARLTASILTAANACALNPFLQGQQNLPNWDDGIVVALPRQATSGLTANFMTLADHLGWVLANEQLCPAVDTALIIWPNLACQVAIFRHKAEVVLHLDQVICGYRGETEMGGHDATKWWASPIREVGVAYWQACNSTRSLLNFLLCTDIVTALQHLLPPSFVITCPAPIIQDEWTVCLHPKCRQTSMATWDYSCRFCRGKDHALSSCYQHPIRGAKPARANAPSAQETQATEVVISPRCLNCFTNDHDTDHCPTAGAAWSEINDPAKDATVV